MRARVWISGKTMYFEWKWTNFGVALPSRSRFSCFVQTVYRIFKLNNDFFAAQVQRSDQSSASDLSDDELDGRSGNNLVNQRGPKKGKKGTKAAPKRSPKYVPASKTKIVEILLKITSDGKSISLQKLGSDKILF